MPFFLSWKDTKELYGENPVPLSEKDEEEDTLFYDSYEEYDSDNEYSDSESESESEEESESESESEPKSGPNRQK